MKWENSDGIDYHQPVSRLFKEAKVMVSPKVQAPFQEFLKAQNIDYKVVTDNVEQ